MAQHISQHQSVDHDDPISIASAAKPLPVVEPGITELQLDFREALVLWLRWNEAYEGITARMFEAGNDPTQLESLMDHLDSLRRRAIKMSHRLLDE